VSDNPPSNDPAAGTAGGQRAPELPEEALLLRIFVGEADMYQHKPLYEAIVLKAREMHLAGATVLRGPMSFGRSSHLHTAKILRLSIDLPLVIEIVDVADKINGFVPLLEDMMQGGLVTLERVQIIHYKHKEKQKATGWFGKH
jgi:uncharacterized protein